jgi:hypothetical protein
MNPSPSVSPKDTLASISPADPVSVGSCVNLTCSSTANPPVINFTWFQICGNKPTQVASGQSYTLNVTVGDGGLYFCEARNSHGCGKSKEVQLAIKGKNGHVGHNRRLDIHYIFKSMWTPLKCLDSAI